MAFTDGKHKVGDKVWVYEFYRLRGKEGHFHNVRPAYGILVGNTGIDGMANELGNVGIKSVILYKNKKGNPTNELSTKKIDIPKVKIADSYIEAVKEYNKLVDIEADFYRNKLEQVESYLIN